MTATGTGLPDDVGVVSVDDQIFVYSIQATACRVQVFGSAHVLDPDEITPAIRDAINSDCRKRGLNPVFADATRPPEADGQAS